MTKTSHLLPTDIQGGAQLVADATIGITDLVEAMQYRISRSLGLPGRDETEKTAGIAGLAYKAVRGGAYLVSGSIDAALSPIVSALGEWSSTRERDAVVSALNGVLGDHLAAEYNPLAIPMSLRANARSLVLERQALIERFPRPGRKLAVLAHGLCMNDRQWSRRGHDHGAALAQDFGYTPLYLHYNSGLHVSSNGRSFAGLLEALVKQWPEPVEELIVVAHSMGGLVTRSACYYGTLAGHQWPQRLRKLVFLGTPHHGAPLERGGNWINVVLQAVPYAAPFARLGKVRSAGITDLRYGNLLDEDWEGRDRFSHSGDQRKPLPLPGGVDCYAIAATLGLRNGDTKDRLLGDGLVPIDSALGRHNDDERSLAFPPLRQWIGYGMNHMALLGNLEVYERLAGFIAE